METTKIPLSQCVESSYQNRKKLGDVSGLARSIEVNGQITPLIAVADGEAYQLVAGHRRTAAMKSLGLEEADAYVMDGWDDEAHVYQPTPEEVAETEAFLGRKATLDAMGGRIAEFAKSIYPKFPAKGQTKLRRWAHEAFEACYECEPDDAWEGFKEPKAKALDQFILMRTIPACVPGLPERVLKRDYEPWSGDLEVLRIRLSARYR